jgi:hypothetical protein
VFGLLASVEFHDQNGQLAWNELPVVRNVLRAANFDCASAVFSAAGFRLELIFKYLFL